MNVIRKHIFTPGDRKSINKMLQETKQIEKSLRRVGREEMPRITRAVDTRILRFLVARLQVYPGRQLGMKIRWKSERQRRYVMMLLTEMAREQGREPGDIAYRRTRNLANGWKALAIWDPQKGVVKIMVENTAETRDRRTGRMVRYHRFVQGDIGLGESKRSLQRYIKPIQPFHHDRGWQPAYPLIQEFVKKAQQEVFTRYEERMLHIIKKGQF